MRVCVCVQYYIYNLFCSVVLFPQPDEQVGRGRERQGVVVMPNDSHYSPLSDAGARSMKLRHFSPERGKRGVMEGEVERDVKRNRGGGVKNAR